MTITVDPPAQLPVDHLSVSSLNLFARCPEKWRRRYIDRAYEPPNGKMLLGSAAGAAEVQHYAHVIESGEGLSVDQVLDEFSAEWEDRIAREEVDWAGEKPGVLKDSGIAALDVYHRRVAPLIVPWSVERKVELSWPGVDWTVLGFLDLEEADGAVVDMKMTGAKWSEGKARAELQPTVYLAARRAEGNPAPEFRYHAMVRGREPQAQVVATSRTDRQLDLLTDRVFSIARAIEWRTLNDCWQGTPPDLAWLCRSCGYTDCPWRLA